MFTREIENIENKAIKNPKIGSKFIELNSMNEIDKEISGKQKQLQLRVEEKIGKNNTKNFKVKYYL